MIDSATTRTHVELCTEVCAAHSEIKTDRSAIAPPRLVMMTTDPFALRAFAIGVLSYFSEMGYEVIAISRPAPDLEIVARRERVRTIGLPMERELRPWPDLRSLIRAYRLFCHLRPTIVNAGTPKAGLLGMVAAWLARVPVRVYTVHGLRLETTRGMKRQILTLAERITSLFATRVICVSESLRQTYLNHRLSRPAKTCVLQQGSFNGIHAEDFAPTEANRAAGEALRAKFKIPGGAPVIGFLGRLVHDKGIAELLAAFELVSSQLPDAWLLIGGSFEAGDPVSPDVVQRLREHPRIVLAGFVDDLPPFYNAVDVLAMPSHREGFPYVPLEAAAAGRPTVGFRVTGMIDAVQDGTTGMLVPLGDIGQLAAALAKYLADPKLRQMHGEAGRARVLSSFCPLDLWRAWDREYSQLLQQAGIVTKATV